MKRRDYLEYVGNKYARLTISGVRRSDGNRPVFECRCDCGRDTAQPVGHVLSGKSVSCGCWRREYATAKAHEASRTHGMSHLPEYRIWLAIRDRCCNPNSRLYRYYGGRGIQMCERWMESPRNFIEDMGPRPGVQEIDRKDNNGPYSPENCAWTTKSQNCRNRRSNIVITAFGETKTAVEWVEDPRCATSYSSLLRRIKSGWNPVLALSTIRSRA